MRNGVDRLVQCFGGLSGMARALGHAHVSTVQGWKSRGSIPRWRIYEIRNSEPGQRNPEIREILAELEKAERHARRDHMPAEEGCRFIHGDPKGEWRYCGKPRRAGSPYCAEHHALCRVPADHPAALAEIDAAVSRGIGDGPMLLRECDR